MTPTTDDSALSMEDGDRHEILIKEFPDAQSGLLVELAHYRENVNNVVRSASCLYINDGYQKTTDEYLDAHARDVFVESTDDLYAGVFRDDDDGYYVEVGEGEGADDPSRTILYATSYSLDDLGLEELNLES